MQSVATERDFEKAWNPFMNKFPHLVEFCGAFATILPNTASVESDFSIINWEKDSFRTGLTDFALDGIMHCKQYDDTEILNNLI